MKVILIKDVAKLGKSEEVIEVKDGYARNYLIPYGFALPATKTDFRRLTEMKNREHRLRDKRKKEAEKIKAAVEKISLTITANVKDDEEIYGTIGESQIVKALKNEEIEVAKEKIFLPQPIKKLGVYTAEVRLHPEVTASLRVWVVKK